MSSLSHHGIKGQKWGVRRFQNKDGTRTAAGKAREDRRVLKKGSMVYRVHAAPKDYVYDNKKYVSTSIEDHNKWADYFGNEYAIRWKPVYYQRYKTKKDLYVATGKDIVDVVSTKLDKQILKRDLDSLEKEVKLRGYDWDNTSKEDHYSMLLGAQKESGKQIVHELQKMGFGAIEDDHGKNVAEDPVIVLDPDKKLRRYGKTAKDTRYLESYRKAFNEFFATHTSIGGTMYIEGNALILGDSSYLEHHGIRGQRWGVRRFQNRDGSLTNAGRKRLGYATKGAVQTVGKAFKAGAKAGGSAVKAVKAHHEKKEAEKLQKKKEKVSKTRLGVMANKDLFTNEEIRKLNERFKLEDEMKMATLQKGVEIAKAVGTIAQNVGTVAKTYEDVTGQSLSPIKRKAAEEKAIQDKEDRERRIAREDADEARKAAKEERDIAIHEQTLRKAIASADTQEFTARKTKAEADSSILDLYKKSQDFNGGSDATGQSWMEKAKNGGKNPFDDMIADRDPEYAQIRKEHDEKVARKERIAELERREKERQAEKEAASKQSAPQQKQGGGDDDALFSQKGSLPIDKDRYRNNRAMEKAKQVKEDAAEERAKKQDEKAAKATIDDMMEARRQFTDSARANSNGAFDRETAANYIKGKAKELPGKLNPVNAIAKKIANKALKEEEDNARKALEDEYKKTSRSQGRDEANYTMYYNRVSALQSQGYSERQAKKVADTESPFSSKRNRRYEYNEKVGEIENTHRKNAKEINKANKELTDYYYKLINGPGYDPGTPKREALDRKYAQKRGELERLEKDNNDMLDREKKKAKKILEHSFSIQNGVLFINAGEPYLEHHGVKGMKWGKHLMAGKGEAGAGGGSGEDDEKLKEMAKKAGMSVAEFKQKFASKIGGAAAKAKKEIGYAYGSEHKKDWERNARLSEGHAKRVRALDEQARNEPDSSHGGDNWYRAAKGAVNEMYKRDDAKYKARKSRKAYNDSLASKVDSAKRKARLTKDRLKSALGKSKQRKQLTTEGPKAKKKVRIESASAMGFSTNNPYSIPVDPRRWGYNATDKSRISVGKRGGNMPKTALNPKHTDTSHRRKSVGEVMNEARKEQTPGNTPIQSPTQYARANRPRGREKYYKLGQESNGVKKRSRRVKHSDDTNAVYTEGTRLVIYPKA